MIPGLPAADSAAVLTLLRQQQGIDQVLLYGSRAMGRNHSGSDVDLCLGGPQPPASTQDRPPQPACAHRAGRGGLALGASAQNRKFRPPLTRQDASNLCSAHSFVVMTPESQHFHNPLFL